MSKLFLPFHGVSEGSKFFQFAADSELSFAVLVRLVSETGPILSQPVQLLLQSSPSSQR